VTLLQTTDLHDHAQGAGRLSGGPSSVGSYARIAAYVAQVRASCAHPVLLVDSGDWSMGTIYDLTLGRRPLALQFVDRLRYDCITLGNHEFDDGPGGLVRILGAARTAFGFRTPIVASNLELHGDPDLAPLFQPGGGLRRALVKTLPNGLRVGFLGLMGRDAAQDAPRAAPVGFFDLARHYERVQALVDELRHRRGCRLVIALDHAGTDASGAGGEDVELARRVTGIDVIASGHAHHPLDAARTVTSGAWTTRILCAGAYGTHVSRLDLLYRADSGTVIVEASSNRPMTDAGLGTLDPPVAADPVFARLQADADPALDRMLAPVLDLLPQEGRNPGAPGGIYRPVARCAQDLRPNDGEGFLAPCGLGDLCADALRAVGNGLRGGGPASPGGDPTPCAVAVVATGVLRGGLEAGAPVSFADGYGILPLGLSPDPAQAGLRGEPLYSVYLDPGGLRELCAMQGLAQAGLAGSSYYLNLSGLSYQLDPQAADTFFVWARCARVLVLTGRRAAAGSAPAAQALAALASLPADQGQALLAAGAAGNPYARALAGPGRGTAGLAQNLDALAQVAAAAVRDGASGTGLDALMMARATAAVGPLSLFDPADPACTGPVAPLGAGRARVVLDGYALAMVDAAQARFGTRAPIYPSATGDALRIGTPEGRRAILANRLALDPGGPFQEVKAWMALLFYLSAPPGRGGHFRGGWISPEYGSSADFRRFASDGEAVRTRNAAYPLDRIRDLAALLEGLEAMP
jgi:hypothetical protein